MGHRASNPHSSGDKACRAIDRQREKERRFMLSTAFKYADDLAIKLVQRLLDTKIIETTSQPDITEVIGKQFRGLQDMEEFDLNFKIAPLRQLVVNPNFMSLFFTQFIIEDLINHDKIDDVFGDDLSIYKAVDSILDKIRPKDQ